MINYLVDLDRCLVPASKAALRLTFYSNGKKRQKRAWTFPDVQGHQKVPDQLCSVSKEATGKLLMLMAQMTLP